MIISLIIHEMLCAALFYMAFCRAVHTSEETTKLSVRLAICALGAVACLGMAAPIVWCWTPNWYTTALLATVVINQSIFSVQWRNGVPKDFCRPTEQS